MNWVEREVKKTEKLVWNYKNLIVLILSIILAVFILKSDFLRIFLLKLGNLEYAGVFISGIFFTYGFTTAPSISMIYVLSRNLNPFLVGLIGAIGAILSDYLIFRFIKYNLSREIKSISKKFKIHPHLKKPYVKILKKLAPLIAGFIIASPLPDELAASILSAIKVNDIEFLLISFFSNFIGILIIALV